MIILGMAHAVAFTCTEHKHTRALQRPVPIATLVCIVQSYGVAVLQAAVLVLIQDVETPALVVCAVGRTGNLKYARKARLSATQKVQLVLLRCIE